MRTKKTEQQKILDAIDKIKIKHPDWNFDVLLTDLKNSMLIQWTILLEEKMPVSVLLFKKGKFAVHHYVLDKGIVMRKIQKVKSIEDLPERLQPEFAKRKDGCQLV